MTSEQRLEHHGYRIRQEGKFWAFGPNGRGALLPSREVAVTRAVDALNLSIAEARAVLSKEEAC